MERIERLEKSIAGLEKAITELKEELKELKEEAKKQAKRPTSLKLHKTSFKVKNSRYNNGSKIVIVEKEENSIAFALTKEDWKKLKSFLDSYFKAGNGSKPAKSSNNGESYSKKSYNKSKPAKVEVEEVEGYENALAED